MASAASTVIATITASISTSAATSFASSTGIRRGESVNVVSAVRCDHSLVIARMPSTGSRKAAAARAAPAKSRNLISPCGSCQDAQTIHPRARTASPTITPRIQRPAR